jgi:hypothetical protein
MQNGRVEKSHRCSDYCRPLTKGFANKENTGVKDLDQRNIVSTAIYNGTPIAILTSPFELFRERSDCGKKRASTAELNHKTSTPLPIDYSDLEKRGSRIRLFT